MVLMNSPPNSNVTLCTYRIWTILNRWAAIRAAATAAVPPTARGPLWRARMTRPTSRLRPAPRACHTHPMPTPQPPTPARTPTRTGHPTTRTTFKNGSKTNILVASNYEILSSCSAFAHLVQRSWLFLLCFACYYVLLLSKIQLGYMIKR